MDQKSSLQKTLFPRFFLKAISLFTVVVFLGTSFSFPASAQAQITDPRLRTTDTNNKIVDRGPWTVDRFVIPSDIGTIAETNWVPGPRTPVLVAGKKIEDRGPWIVDRFVVLIQDAHSVPDAQRSLEKLIEYLQKNYGVATVAVEGAEGKLDSTLFRMFPDAKKREDVFADYLASGELSGAAAASVLSSGKAEFVGIEDWKLYQEGVAAFLSGLGKQADLKSQISDLKSGLQGLKEKYYSREALEFDAKLSVWNADPAKLMEFLSSVIPAEAGIQGLDSRLKRSGMTSDSFEEKYPHLVAIMKSVEQEKIRDPRLEAEVKKLAQYAHKTAPSAPEPRRVQGSPAPHVVQDAKLNSLVQDYRTGRLSLVAFACELLTLIRHPVSTPGVKTVEISPKLQELITNHEKLAGLKGPALVKELDAFLDEVRTKLPTTPEAKAVSELDRQLNLFEKLIKFELSRSEWESLRAGNGPNSNQSERSGDWGRPNYHSGKEIESLDGERGAGNASEMIDTLRKKVRDLYGAPLVTDFFRFYEIAIKRETVFKERLFSLLGLNVARLPFSVPRVTSAVALVAGGFHTAGLAARLKEQGIPYVVVSPAMKEVPQDNRYFDHMQGKVSWQKYFRPKDGRMDLYDAFARATAEKLLGGRGQGIGDRKLNPKPYALNAKEWRDSIIRELAASGRVAEHSKYTRYIDQQIAGNSEEFQKLKESWTAKLERFIEKLQFLGQNHQITEANVAKLLSQPANQTPYAVNMVPGMSVPESFLRDRVEGIGDRKNLTPKPDTLNPKNGEAARSEAREDERLKPEPQPETLRDMSGTPPGTPTPLSGFREIVYREGGFELTGAEAVGKWIAGIRKSKEPYIFNATIRGDVIEFEASKFWIDKANNRKKRHDQLPRFTYGVLSGNLMPDGSIKLMPILMLGHSQAECQKAFEDMIRIARFFTEILPGQMVPIDRQTVEFFTETRSLALERYVEETVSIGTYEDLARQEIPVRSEVPLTSVKSRTPQPATNESRRAEMRETEMNREITVKNPLGIHVMPSAIIARMMTLLLRHMAVESFIFKAGQTHRLRMTEVMNLPELEIQNGDRVTVFVKGPQTEAVLTKVLELIERLLQDPKALEGGSFGPDSKYREEILALAQSLPKARSEVRGDVGFSAEGIGDRKLNPEPYTLYPKTAESRRAEMRQVTVFGRKHPDYRRIAKNFSDREGTVQALKDLVAAHPQVDLVLRPVAMTATDYGTLSLLGFRTHEGRAQALLSLRYLFVQWLLEKPLSKVERNEEDLLTLQFNVPVLFRGEPIRTFFVKLPSGSRLKESSEDFQSWIQTVEKGTALAAEDRKKWQEALAEYLEQEQLELSVDLQAVPVTFRIDGEYSKKEVAGSLKLDAAARERVLSEPEFETKQQEAIEREREQAQAAAEAEAATRRAETAGSDEEAILTHEGSAGGIVSVSNAILKNVVEVFAEWLGLYADHLHRYFEKNMLSTPIEEVIERVNKKIAKIWSPDLKLYMRDSWIRLIKEMRVLARSDADYQATLLERMQRKIDDEFGPYRWVYLGPWLGWEQVLLSRKKQEPPKPFDKSEGPTEPPDAEAALSANEPIQPARSEARAALQEQASLARNSGREENKKAGKVPAVRFETSDKGKNRTGQSKWDLFDQFKEQLAGVSPAIIEELQGTNSIGRWKKILIGAGVAVAAEIDGRFLNTAIQGFLESIPVAVPKKIDTRLRSGNNGRYLLVYLNDDFDYIIKTYYKAEKKRTVQIDWQDAFRYLAQTRLKGIAVPTLIIDATAGDKKEFAFRRENGTFQKTDIAIIQGKVTPLYEYLYDLERKGDFEGQKRVLEDFKKLVFEMFRRGVVDVDYGGILANYGVDEKTGKVWLFDFGDLSGRFDKADEFVSNTDYTNENIVNGLSTNVGDKIADYFLEHGFTEDEFKDPQTGRDFFGVAVAQGERPEFEMSFPYKEDEVRVLFADHEVHEARSEVRASEAYEMFKKTAIRYAEDAVDFNHKGNDLTNDAVARAAIARLRELYRQVPGVIRVPRGKLTALFGDRQEEYSSRKDSLFTPFDSLDASTRQSLLTWRNSFNRSEVPLTSVKSRTPQPATNESRRAEVRREKEKIWPAEPDWNEPDPLKRAFFAFCYFFELEKCISSFAQLKRNIRVSDKNERSGFLGRWMRRLGLGDREKTGRTTLLGILLSHLSSNQFQIILVALELFVLSGKTDKEWNQKIAANFSRIRESFLRNEDSLEMALRDDFMAYQGVLKRHKGTEADPVPYSVKLPYFLNVVFNSDEKLPGNDLKKFREGVAKLFKAWPRVENAMEAYLDSVGESIPSSVPVLSDDAVEKQERWELLLKNLAFSFRWLSTQGVRFMNHRFESKAMFIAVAACCFLFPSVLWAAGTSPVEALKENLRYWQLYLFSWPYLPGLIYLFEARGEEKSRKARLTPEVADRSEVREEVAEIPSPVVSADLNKIKTFKELALTINPGSTSKKAGNTGAKISLGGEIDGVFRLFEYDIEVPGKTGKTDVDAAHVEKAILAYLEEIKIDLNSIIAVSGRGGMLKPTNGGLIRINTERSHDGRLKLDHALWKDLVDKPKFKHESNMGAVIAASIASKIGQEGVPAFVLDPVTTDGIEPIRRPSGKRGSVLDAVWHALNCKAVVRTSGKSNVVVVHIGGGTTVAPFRDGIPIAVSDALGNPIMSMTRGIVATLVEIFQKMLALFETGTSALDAMVAEFDKGSGVEGYTGSNNLIDLEKLIARGKELERGKTLVIDENAMDRLVNWNNYEEQIAWAMELLAPQARGQQIAQKDLREIIKARVADRVLEVFARKLVKEIAGSITAIERPLDGVIFTGGGAKNKLMMEKIVEAIDRSYMNWPLFKSPGSLEQYALATAAYQAVTGEDIHVSTYAEPAVREFPPREDPWKDIDTNESVPDQVFPVKTPDDLIVFAKARGPRKIVLAEPNESSLKALEMAVKEGLIHFVYLVGDRKKIESFGVKFPHEIIHVEEEKDYSAVAVRMAKEGAADLVMKGAMSSGTILSAVLDKKKGLGKDDVATYVTLVFSPVDGKPLLITDAGINLYPLVPRVMAALIKKGASLAYRLGLSPTVALVNASEKANPKSYSSVRQTEAASRKWSLGDKPFPVESTSWDVGTSLESAAAKNALSRPASGKTKVLVFSSIDGANAVYKIFEQFVKNFSEGFEARFGFIPAMASVVMGTSKPFVLISRDDPPETKLLSIALSILLLAEKDGSSARSFARGESVRLASGLSDPIRLRQELADGRDSQESHSPYFADRPTSDASVPALPAGRRSEAQTRIVSARRQLGSGNSRSEVRDAALSELPEGVTAVSAKKRAKLLQVHKAAFELTAAGESPTSRAIANRTGLRAQYVSGLGAELLTRLGGVLEKEMDPERKKEQQERWYAQMPEVVQRLRSDKETRMKDPTRVLVVSEWKRIAGQDNGPTYAQMCQLDWERLIRAGVSSDKVQDPQILASRETAELGWVEEIVRKLSVEGIAPTVPQVAANSKRLCGHELSETDLRSYGWEKLEKNGVIKREFTDPQLREERVRRALARIKVAGSYNGRIYETLAAEMNRDPDPEEREILSGNTLFNWVRAHPQFGFKGKIEKMFSGLKTLKGAETEGVPEEQPTTGSSEVSAQAKGQTAVPVPSPKVPLWVNPAKKTEPPPTPGASEDLRKRLLKVRDSWATVFSNNRTRLAVIPDASARKWSITFEKNEASFQAFSQTVLSGPPRKNLAGRAFQWYQERLQEGHAGIKDAAKLSIVLMAFEKADEKRKAVEKTKVNADEDEEALSEEASALREVLEELDIPKKKIEGLDLEEMWTVYDQASPDAFRDFFDASELDQYVTFQELADAIRESRNEEEDDDGSTDPEDPSARSEVRRNDLASSVAFGTAFFSGFVVLMAFPEISLPEALAGILGAGILGFGMVKVSGPIGRIVRPYLPRAMPKPPVLEILAANVESGTFEPGDRILIGTGIEVEVGGFWGSDRQLEIKTTAPGDHIIFYHNVWQKRRGSIYPREAIGDYTRPVSMHLEARDRIVVGTAEALNFPGQGVYDRIVQIRTEGFESGSDRVRMFVTAPAFTPIRIVRIHESPFLEPVPNIDGPEKLRSEVRERASLQEYKKHLFDLRLEAGAAGYDPEKDAKKPWLVWRHDERPWQSGNWWSMFRRLLHVYETEFDRLPAHGEAREILAWARSFPAEDLLAIAGKRNDAILKKMDLLKQDLAAGESHYENFAKNAWWFRSFPWLHSEPELAPLVGLAEKVNRLVHARGQGPVAAIRQNKVAIEQTLTEIGKRFVRVEELLELLKAYHAEYYRLRLNEREKLHAAAREQAFEAALANRPDAPDDLKILFFEFVFLSRTKDTAAFEWIHDPAQPLLPLDGKDVATELQKIMPPSVREAMARRSEVRQNKATDHRLQTPANALNRGSWTVDRGPITRSEAREIKTADDLADYIDKIVGAINLFAGDGREVSISGIVRNPQKYEDEFYGPLFELFFMKLREDFEDVQGFVDHCRSILRERGAQALREAMNKPSAEMLGLLRKIHHDGHPENASIDLYGQLLSFLTTDLEDHLGHLYDELIQTRPGIAIAREGVSYHSRAESTIRLYDKGILYGTQKAVEKYKEVRDSSFDRTKLDVSGRRNGTHAEKILAGLASWEKQAKKIQDERARQVIRGRIANFKRSAVVVEFDSDLPLIIADTERNVARVFGTERLTHAIHGSSAFIDEASPEELAEWFNGAQEWLDIYVDWREMYSKIPADRRNDAMNEEFASAVEESRSTFNLKFFNITDLGLIPVGAQRERWPEGTTGPTLEDLLGARMKNHVLKRYKGFLSSMIDENEKAEKLFADGRELQARDPKARGTEKQRYDAREPFAVAHTIYARLLNRYEAMGMYARAEKIFRKLVYTTAAVQLYDLGGLLPHYLGQELVFIALRLGLWDDFLNELEIAWTGRPDPERGLREEILEGKKRRGYPRKLTTLNVDESERILGAAWFSTKLKTAMKAQLLATPPDLIKKRERDIERVNRLLATPPLSTLKSKDIDPDFFSDDDTASVLALPEGPVRSEARLVQIPGEAKGSSAKKAAAEARQSTGIEPVERLLLRLKYRVNGELEAKLADRFGEFVPVLREIAHHFSQAGAIAMTASKRILISGVIRRSLSYYARYGIPLREPHVLRMLAHAILAHKRMHENRSRPKKFESQTARRQRLEEQSRPYWARVKEILAFIDVNLGQVAGPQDLQRRLPQLEKPQIDQLRALQSTTFLSSGDMKELDDIFSRFDRRFRAVTGKSASFRSTPAPSRLLKNSVILNNAQHREGSPLEILRPRGAQNDEKGPVRSEANPNDSIRLRQDLAGGRDSQESHSPYLADRPTSEGPVPALPAGRRSEARNPQGRFLALPGPDIQEPSLTGKTPDTPGVGKGGYETAISQMAGWRIRSLIRGIFRMIEANPVLAGLSWAIARAGHDQVSISFLAKDKSQPSFSFQAGRGWFFGLVRVHMSVQMRGRNLLYASFWGTSPYVLSRISKKIDEWLKQIPSRIAGTVPRTEEKNSARSEAREPLGTVLGKRRTVPETVRSVRAEARAKKQVAAAQVVAPEVVAWPEAPKTDGLDIVDAVGAHLKYVRSLIKIGEKIDDGIVYAGDSSSSYKVPFSHVFHDLINGGSVIGTYLVQFEAKVSGAEVLLKQYVDDFEKRLDALDAVSIDVAGKTQIDFGAAGTAQDPVSDIHKAFGLLVTRVFLEGPDRERKWKVFQSVEARLKEAVAGLKRETAKIETIKTGTEDAKRSETRSQQIYSGVLDTVLRQKPAAENLAVEFTGLVRADFGRAVNDLRAAFEDFVPVAFAAMTVGDTSLAAGFQSLDQVMRDKNMTRESLNRIAEQMFENELKSLAEAITKKETGGMAPVVFYSPEMKARLIRFIETVQQGFEATGDVTGKNYRITLVSANKAELMKFKTELSKRGALRGVSFEENGKSLERNVFENARFKDRFGVFFPEGGLAGNAPWQRVVRSEIPKEYAMLLLPALSRYFASVSTSDINATTLRQALPDLTGIESRSGEGLWVAVSALLNMIAKADHQISASA